jgi:hypothetical protein
VDDTFSDVTSDKCATVTSLIELGFTCSDLRLNPDDTDRVQWIKRCTEEWSLLKPDIEEHLPMMSHALQPQHQSDKITKMWRTAAAGFESVEAMLVTAKKVNKNKSSYRLSIEQILFGSRELQEIVFEACKLHFAGVHCSQAKTGCVVPLYKSPAKWRPVTLLTAVDKICAAWTAQWESLILREVGDSQQFGGMPGRSMDAIHLQFNLLWEEIDRQHGALRVDIDIADNSSAYDSVPHRSLPALWQRYGMPRNVGRIRLGSLTGHTRVFRVANAVTADDDCAHLFAGGPQGRSTSGLIWFACLDAIIAAVRHSDTGQNKSKVTLTTSLGTTIDLTPMCFVDDSTAPSTADTGHKTMECISVACAALGVIVNIDKTCRLSSYEGTIPIEYNALNKKGRYVRGRLRQVDEVKILGVDYKKIETPTGPKLSRDRMRTRAHTGITYHRARCTKSKLGIDATTYANTAIGAGSIAHIVKAAMISHSDCERDFDPQTAAAVLQALRIPTEAVTPIQQLCCQLPVDFLSSGAQPPSTTFSTEIVCHFMSVLNGDNDVAKQLLKATLHDATTHYGKTFLHILKRLNLSLHHNKGEGGPSSDPLRRTERLGKEFALTLPTGGLLFVVARIVDIENGSINTPRHHDLEERATDGTVTAAPPRTTSYATAITDSHDAQVDWVTAYSALPTAVKYMDDESDRIVVLNRATTQVTANCSYPTGRRHARLIPGSNADKTARADHTFLLSGPIGIDDDNVLGVISADIKAELHLDFKEVMPLQGLSDTKIDELWTSVHAMSAEMRRERAADVYAGQVTWMHQPNGQHMQNVSGIPLLRYADSRRWGSVVGTVSHLNLQQVAANMARVNKAPSVTIVISGGMLSANLFPRIHKKLSTSL